jgi:hypothetical protein
LVPTGGGHGKGDGYEPPARIVEAFAAEQSDAVTALLARIAMVIREKALED